MTDFNQMSDEDLLVELRNAVDANLPVPDAMAGMIMAGYDITNLDASVAELIEDTRVGEVAGVRSGATASDDTRLVTFQHDDLVFELEIGPEAPQIVGHVEGGGAGTVRFEQPAAPAPPDPVVLDDLGSFEFIVGSSRPFRLRYEPAAGDAPIVTDWLLP